MTFPEQKVLVICPCRSADRNEGGEHIWGDQREAIDTTYKGTKKILTVNNTKL